MSYKCNLHDAFIFRTSGWLSPKLTTVAGSSQMETAFVTQSKAALYSSVTLVPAIEGVSVSSFTPKTTTEFTSTVATMRGQSDTTVGGSDPREGRDPFEGSQSSVTSEPTVPELPQTPRRFCEATRRRAIDWPQTHTGTTVERPCPKGTKGRYFSKCISVYIFDLLLNLDTSFLFFYRL